MEDLSAAVQELLAAVESDVMLWLRADRTARWCPASSEPGVASTRLQEFISAALFNHKALQ